jgi:exonuclease SbcC
MIPINLKITGLYSYLKQQEIDFTRLTEAGLFGIFGQVGSGKSALIEAMAFAIYDKTERLGNGDNRYYNMLNLKSTEAIIDFTFKAGKENKIYNIYVRLLRNSNNFEDVNQKEHNYYLVNGSKKEPIKYDVVWDEIGVDYNNFKRTVIIPQGQFKDFLELGPKDRTDMLKELFSLQKFDLSSKLTLIEKINKSKLDVLSGEMIGKEGITDDLLEESIKDSLEKEKALEDLKTELKNKEEELNRYNHLEEDFRSYNNKRAEYQEKLKHSESIKARETEANEFDFINSVFSSVVKEMADLSKDITERTKIEQEHENSKNNASRIQKELEIKFKEIEKNFNLNVNLKDTTTKLNKLTTLLDLEAKLVELSKEINQSEEKINIEIIEKQKSVSNVIDSLEKENIGLEKHSLEDAYINAMNAWYIKMDFSRKTIIKLKEEKDELLKKAKTQRESLNKILRGKNVSLFSDVPDDFNEVEFNKAYRDFQSNSKEELEKLKILKSDVDLKCKLQEYAGHLEDGHACVLCGSLEHPNPLSSENFDQQLKELNDAVTANNLKEEELKKLSTLILKGLIELDGVNETIDKIDLKISEENSNSTDLQTTQPIGRFNLTNYSEFVNSVKEIEENKKKIKLNNEKLTKQREVNKTLAANLDIEKGLLDIKKVEYQTGKGSLNTMSEEIKTIDRSAYAKKSIEEIKTEAKSIEDQIEKNTKEFDEATKEKRRIEDLLLNLKGKLEAEQKEIASTKVKLDFAKIEFNEKLKKNNLTDNNVQLILKKKLNLAELRKEIEEFKKTLNILVGEINSLKEKVNEKIFDKDVHEDLKIKTAEQKLKYEVANKALITLKNEVKRLSDILKKKKQIQDDFNKLTIRAADIVSMGKLFKASGFVDFISRRYLQNIVSIANSRFYKMSRQKFKMELSEKGEFLVRDFMNEGKTRLLKSLSGGQTFQAALSLSLALSESIQRNAGVDQNFFFLDEGFGTLDKESLQTVFETLKSLRQENRVVGLISHVEELQQEMDVFLKIENVVDAGTKIKGSWEL